MTLPREFRNAFAANLGGHANYHKLQKELLEGSLEYYATAQTVEAAEEDPGAVTTADVAMSIGKADTCYPANTDVKDQFIPISRMFDWVGNTLIRTFWSKLDRPMNRRLIDNIPKIWLGKPSQTW